MQKFRRAGRIWLPAMLMLSSLALTGCLSAKQAPKVHVLPEARTVKLTAGSPAPFDVWLLTDGAMAKVLEAGERCLDRKEK